ncbi:unnamed protein product, partial [Brassica oleracea var. botrytis]
LAGWLFLNATSGTHLYFDKETSDGDTFVSHFGNDDLASSTSLTKYGGVNKIETVAESGLDTYVVKSPPQDWLFIPYQHIRTKTNLRKLVTEEMLQLDGHNSIIIVDGANMIGWPEKMIDDELEIVRNAGVVQLQREIPHSINIQVAKVGGGCVAGCEESSCAGHLTWKESIPQSLMSYWIQLTSCNIMKLSSVA